MSRATTKLGLLSPGLRHQRARAARDTPGQNVERQLDTVDVAPIGSESGDPLPDVPGRGAEGPGKSRAGSVTERSLSAEPALVFAYPSVKSLRDLLPLFLAESRDWDEPTSRLKSVRRWTDIHRHRPPHAELFVERRNDHPEALPVAADDEVVS